MRPDVMPEFYLPARHSVREATGADITSVRNFLIERLAEFELDLDHYGTDRDIEGLPGSFRGGYFGIIETESGEIKGTFALYPVDNVTGEIRKMYLHPSLRGIGLGRSMLEFLEHVAKAAGFQVLQLETSSEMKTARMLYAKFGYQEIEKEGQTIRCDREYRKTL